MIIGILKLLFTAALMLIGVITAKKDYKKKSKEKLGIKKFFNLINISLLFIFLLFVSEMIAFFDQIQKAEVQENKITETNTNVKEAREKINSVSDNMQTQIETTEKEINLLSDLNIDLKEARKNISKNLIEYEKINLLYSEQIKLERIKILTGQPDIEINRPITLSDSINFFGQYNLTNTGQRTADSIKFFSFMVLLDSVNMFSKVTILRTNINDQNILSLSPGGEFNHFINYPICLKKDTDNYRWGYLIVKFSYYDLMMDTTIISPVHIFQSPYLNELDKQYAFNVPQSVATKIKHYINTHRPDIYDLFW